MAYDAYQSAALILRYGLTALGVYIAGRAAYMTLRDGRNAARIRAGAKDNGIIAQLVITGAERDARKVDLQREGAVGGGIGADIRVGGLSLRRRQFYYEIVNGNLIVTALARTTVQVKRNGEGVKTLTVKPGGRFFAQGVMFTFIMYRQKAAPLSPMALRAYGGALDAVLNKRVSSKEGDENARQAGGAERAVNARK